MNCCFCYTPIWGHCWARALSTFTLGVSSSTSHGRNSWAVVTLTRNSINESLDTNRTAKCQHSLTSFNENREEKKKLTLIWEHLHVISQTVGSVDHCLSWRCRAAWIEMTTQLIQCDPLHNFEQQKQRRSVCACAWSVLTDLRLPPIASTLRQILKADAPFVVYKSKNEISKQRRLSG